MPLKSLDDLCKCIAKAKNLRLITSWYGERSQSRLHIAVKYDNLCHLLRVERGHNLLVKFFNLTKALSADCIGLDNIV